MPKFFKNPLVITVYFILLITVVTFIGIQTLGSNNSKNTSISNSTNLSSSSSNSTSNSSLSQSMINSSVNSSSSVTSQSSIQSSVTSPSSSVQSSTTIPSISSQSSIPSGPTLISYKNPYFPNFELNYSSDWNVKNTTKPSPYIGLLERTISFSKNTTKFEVFLTPFPRSGCGGSGFIQSVNSVDLGNGISRIRVNFEGGDSYQEYTKSNSPTPNCYQSNVINSNIQAKDVPDYANSLDKGSNVKYIFEIITPGLTSTSPNADFAEIDKIIGNSKFN